MYFINISEKKKKTSGHDEAHQNSLLPLEGILLSLKLGGDMIVSMTTHL